MSLWVELPEPLDAAELLPKAQAAGVAYLPGRYFAVSRMHQAAFRLSFAGTPPDTIKQGVSLLGRVFREEMERVPCSAGYQAATAMV